MICTKCKLMFSDHIEICPQCNEQTIEDRRKDSRRKELVGISGRDRRMSDRRKELIKRFDEIFWKGDSKYC